MKNKPGPLSTAERQSRHRSRIEEAGGRQIAVMLTPEASSKLDAWTATGQSIRAVINRLLVRSRPPG